MFNRKFLFFAGLALVALIAVGALMWFIGPRLGWGPMALGRGMHPGLWSDMRPGMNGFEGMMPRTGPHAGFGGMAFGWGGILGLGLVRLVGWLLQIGLIVAIVTWLLRRQALSAQPTQSIPTAPPSEPSTPAQN